MTQEQSQVRFFMEKAGQECPSKPAMPHVKIMLLRSKLIREELAEYDTACLLEDEVAVADAVGDLLYVVIGTAVAFGIDIDPIFQEIHRSNMSKFIDGHRREDGKWIKGPSYSPANLAPIIEAQKQK